MMLASILLAGCSARKIEIPVPHYLDVYPPDQFEQDCKGEYASTVVDAQRLALIEEVKCERAKSAAQRAYRAERQREQE